MDLFDAIPPPARAGTSELAFTERDLGALRRVVLQWASAFALGRERTEHLILATSELASNSVRHGGGGGTMRMWCEQDTLLVEICDRGHIKEPLTGRIRPSPAQPTGRGLWLVNQLCDVVQIRSVPGRTVVRVQMRLIQARTPPFGAKRCDSISGVASQDQLRIDVQHEKDRVVLYLSGELDLASAPLLQQEVDSAALASAAMVVLDLQQLEFVDSTGLRVLLSAHERSRERGQEFAMTPGSQQVQRLLSITGVGEHLRTVAPSDEMRV